MSGAATDTRLSTYRQWHALAGPYFRWQFEQFQPRIGRRVADIGCGPGNLTEFLVDREHYLAVDRDPLMLQELRRNHAGATAIETAALDVTDPALPALLREHRVDTVLCLNLLEHVVDDNAALSHLVDGLPPGGTLGLLVPAHPFLYGTLDALDDHVRRYTRDQIAEQLARQPVRLVRLRYFNALGALGWWWAGRVRKMAAHQAANYTRMNRILPLARFVERAIAPPFGLSVVAVAIKK